MNGMINNLSNYCGDYCGILQAIIEELPIPISIVGNDEKFAMVNKAYEEMFYIKREMLLGKHYSCHVDENSSSIHQVVLLQKKSYRGTKSMGKEKRLVEVEGVPLFIDGKLACSVAVIYEFSNMERTMGALERMRQTIQEIGTERPKYSFLDILGNSDAIKRAIHAAEMAAATNVTVLLRGESGTGKELFAHAIQLESARRNCKFIRVNCTSIPETLLESVLFGYVEHSFTGAKKGGEIGLFEAADGGTIFLDEIGDISLSLQSKLLRVLQEREITKVGGIKTKTVNVRIITATNADLEKQIDRKLFRSDLYYRLNMFPIFIPSLRERKSDIGILAEFFIKQHAKEYQKSVCGLSADCLRVLTEHDWPGNVRELSNTIARAIINMPDEQQTLHAENVQFIFVPSRFEYASRHADSSRASSYKERFENWEREMISDIYRQEGMNKTKTAARLNISVRSVYEKLKKYGVGVEEE